jgi:hypothetical protein
MANIRTPSATRLRWVLGLTAIAHFTVVLDSLVFITALPQMQRNRYLPRPAVRAAGGDPATDPHSPAVTRPSRSGRA